MRLNTFEERLQWARRNHAGITQRELAKKMRSKYEISVGSNYISEIELGKDKKPSFAVVRAMAGAMDVSLDWLALFTEEIEIPKGKEIEATYFSEEADEAAQLIDKMPPEQRLLVLSLTRNLAASMSPDRQLRIAEVMTILDSIERKLGKEARIEIEQDMRNKGIEIDGAV